MNFLKFSKIPVCSHNCVFCINPCYMREFPKSQFQDFSDPVPLSKKDIIPVSTEEEKGAEKAFDAPVSTELAVVENIGTFELVKPRIGREKVRRIK